MKGGERGCWSSTARFYSSVTARLAASTRSKRMQSVVLCQNTVLSGVERGGGTTNLTNHTNEKTGKQGWRSLGPSAALVYPGKCLRVIGEDTSGRETHGLLLRHWQSKEPATARQT